MGTIASSKKQRHGMRNGKQSHHAPKPRDADQSVNNTDRIEDHGLARSNLDSYCSAQRSRHKCALPSADLTYSLTHLLFSQSCLARRDRATTVDRHSHSGTVGNLLSLADFPGARPASKHLMMIWIEVSDGARQGNRRG
jgi:hypothetical protein